MATRFFTTGCALVLGGLLLSECAVAQTPAAITYGSIGSSTNSPLITTNYTPVYVAQNTTPATITPIPTTPSGIPSVSPAVVPLPFDPYAVPSQTTSFGSLFPSTGTNLPSPSSSAGVYSGNFDRFVPETYEAMRRFRDATSVQYTHLPSGKGDKAFGMDEIDIRMQLAFPCRFIPDNGRTGYFYVAPGGSLAWWSGPTGPPDMSPNGFGAFLDFGVQPRFNETFGLIAWGRIGLFSDFEKVTSDAWRYQGRLVGVINSSPQMQFHLGAIYYGRARVKMMPTAGVIWTPDENWVLKLVFPNPRVQRRLWRGPQTDWWGYVHMDYAGGSWDIEGLGLTDYNDVRLGIGVEFTTQNRVGGYLEFGGSLARELYTGGQCWMEPPSVLYLKTGVIF